MGMTHTANDDNEAATSGRQRGSRGTRGSGPKIVKFSNGTYMKSDMPESMNR
jgi:hypothetical protein